MTGNHLLDSLEASDRDFLLATLTPIAVKPGDVLIAQGERIGEVHFPTTACLANLTFTPGGRSLQTAMVGYEGLSGLVPFLADAPCAWEVRGMVAGQALVASASVLRHVQARSPFLAARLMALTYFYQARATQLAVCNAFHRIDARVARWLLTAAELSGQDVFEITQDDIALHLGVQRTSVVEAFRILKSAGLFRHGRGRLTITSRTALEGRACTCHEQLRQLGDSLGVLPAASGGGSLLRAV